MRFELGLAQVGYPQDGDVLAQAEEVMREARARGADLIAFPENFMCPRELSAEELRKIAEPLDGPFVHDVSHLARELGLWAVFTMSEACPAGPPYNTAVVVGDDGIVRAAYRKCHLYDAHGVLESERMTPGGQLFGAVETPFCKLGLGICYDLRFPEVARMAALAGCDLMLYPSAWHDGPHKSEHWQTLLRARAIENEMFVAGICHAAGRHVGLSMLVDPLGEVQVQGPACKGSDSPALVCHGVDTDAVWAARDAMPVLEHRRPDLYDTSG